MKKLIFILIVLIILFIIAPGVKAENASLYLSPSTGTYIINSNFSIAIQLNSGGVAINAAEGSLTFNPDEIEVVSISRSGSIFTLWTTQPTFSNSLGKIEFAGGTPESFSGIAGTIITITFKAKSVTAAKVNFSSGKVLVADGKGTNALAYFGSGNYIIKSKIEYIPPENTPTAPVISSPTHSDSEKWYSNNDPKFKWEVPQGILGVKLLADQNSLAIPTVFYSEPISEKQLEDIADGIWYFHTQLQNKFGWGEIANFKFQIDTTNPSPFEIKVKDGQETTDPRPTLFFETTDGLSGVAYYELRIDQEVPIKIEKNEFEMPAQRLGKHIIIIKAVDKAGNYSLAMTEINILPRKNPIILIAGFPIYDLTIFIIFLILIIILGIIWAWRKINQKRKKLKKEIGEAEKASYLAFKALKEKIEREVAKLDGEPNLSKREKKTSDELKESLRASEKIINKEIKDIEREL